ncbi:hypothetical protein B566_EDAN015566 [Ephemera danica]|nr:hypothetical protein B566_EDAN015566 [Ephemera danica]
MNNVSHCIVTLEKLQHIYKDGKRGEHSDTISMPFPTSLGSNETDLSTTMAPILPVPGQWNYTYFMERDWDENTFQCREPYGCFSIGSHWPSHRPVNLFPESAAKIGPNFCLFTEASPVTCQRLLVNDSNSFFTSYIRGGKKRKTFFIIHGYLESGNKTWIQGMTHELLKAVTDANVITVDWQGGSGPPRRWGCTRRTATSLVTPWGHTPPDTLATRSTSGALLSAASLVRLDPSDAAYVDVIHTDAAPFISGGFGLLQPVGHVDFYPNGGQSQPGCDNTVLDSIKGEKGLLLGIRRALGCNHVRSYEFFTESINTQCDFLAVECESYEMFEAGDCFACPSTNYYNVEPTCSRLGFDSSPSPPRNQIQLYLKTAAKPPFCRHHYRVELQISNSTRSYAHGGEVGEFWFELFDDVNSSSQRMRLQDGSTFFEPGSKRRRVIPGARLGRLAAATVEWVYRSAMWNPLTWRLLATPQIYLDWVRIDVLETGQSLKSGLPVTFTAARNSCRPRHPTPHS